MSCTQGQEVSLVAQSDLNSAFLNWSGDFNSEKDTLKFVIDNDKTIQANFVETEFTLPEPDFSMIGYATVAVKV